MDVKNQFGAAWGFTFAHTQTYSPATTQQEFTKEIMRLMLMVPEFNFPVLVAHDEKTQSITVRFQSDAHKSIFLEKALGIPRMVYSHTENFADPHYAAAWAQTVFELSQANRVDVDITLEQLQVIVKFSNPKSLESFLQVHKSGIFNDLAREKLSGNPYSDPSNA